LYLPDDQFYGAVTRKDLRQPKQIKYVTHLFFYRHTGYTTSIYNIIIYCQNSIAMDDLLEFFDGDEEAAKDRVRSLAGALRRKRKLEKLYERSTHSASAFIRRKHRKVDQRPALMDIDLPHDPKDIIRDFLMQSKTTIQQNFEQVMGELLEVIQDVNSNLNLALESENLPGNLVALWTRGLGGGSRPAYETITNTNSLFELWPHSQ
jgi:hypothetical protein